MFYVKRGRVPHKRHTQHRARDGSLYAEELFGVEGFVGRCSLLYHRVPPTRTHRIEPLGPVKLEELDDGIHRHRLINSGGLPPKGDVVTGRVPLFFNSDVTLGVVRPR
jgi:homogentisate 1,2-dioxygenase